MTATAKRLLEAFDRLSEQERSVVGAEILRRTRDLEYPPFDDESLAQIADESFQEYDSREAADAQR